MTKNEMANKAMKELKEASWGLNTSQLRSRIGVTVDEQADLRFVLNRLETLKKVQKIGGTPFKWKLIVSEWDAVRPFDESTTIKDATKDIEKKKVKYSNSGDYLPDDAGDDALNFPIPKFSSPSGTYPKSGPDTMSAENKAIAQAMILLEKKVDAIDSNQMTVAAQLTSMAEKLEKAQEIAKRSVAVLKVEKYDGKTVTLKNKILPKVFQQVLDLVRCRRNVMLVGPAGCLHADTMIEDPVDRTLFTVEERTKRREPFFVWSLDNNKRIVLAVAKPPVKYESVPMYEVTTSKGRKYKVTGEHQILTLDHGFVSLYAIAAGRYGAFSQVLLPCVSESVPSIRTSNGPHSRQTTGDYPNGYHSVSCSDGAQPPSLSTDAQSAGTSQGDAPARNHSEFASDGPSERGQECNHLSTNDDHLSTHGCLPPCDPSIPCDQNERESVSPSSQSSQRLSQSEKQTNKNGTSEGHEDAPILPNAVAFSSATTNDHPESQSNENDPYGLLPRDSLRHKNQSPVSSSILIPTVPKLSHPEATYGDSPLVKTPWWTETDYIVEIRPIGNQPYFDFHVPVHNNYLLKGMVHHNCGKTYLAKLVADSLGMEFGTLSCTSGMSENHLLGRGIPDLTHGKNRFQSTEFLDLYEKGGMFLLDEFDAADPNLLLAVNTALANGYCNVPNRTDKPKALRHKDNVIMATANTYGRGANRVYAGRNQLDEATLDRFRMGMVEMDYDEAVEAAVCPDDELREKLQGIRTKIQGTGLRRIMSSRFMEDAYVMKKECSWSVEAIVATFLQGWTPEEKSKVVS